MLDRKRITTGQALLAVGLVALGLVIGWLTAGDGGESTDGNGGANVGPSDSVKGIPVGYERSREGAAAAALNYGTVLARPEFVTDPRRRAEILEVIATPAEARRYEEEDRVASLASLAQTPVYRATREGEPSVWQTTPLGYRVERYNRDDAQLFVWSAAITGASEAPPRASFGSGSVALRWEGDDWKFAGDIGRTEDGPTPALAEGAPASSSNEFRARLRGLQGLRYVP
jgi:hypothetical protein